MKPVVIAGAGPVGCAAALYLVKNNIPVVMLEACVDLPRDLRASTFHPPTLDMLSELGIVERIIEKGLLVPNYQYRDRRTGEVANFELQRLEGETAYPYRLQCEQYKMTEISLWQLKADTNFDMRFGTKIKGFRETSDGVEVLAFSDANGEERLQGSYLIGADGADSVVRQSSGVLFEGLTYPERFLVVSTPFAFEYEFDHLAWVNYVSDPDEWCVLLKTVDFWRVLFPTELDQDGGRFLDDDYIQERLQRLAPSASPYEIVHKTLYRVHQRVAEKYRAGKRVLLAGDAAHINNPLGGMGMNGGIHDAINLAQKIVSILQTGADEDECLDLYERQRRGICVKFVQRHTMRNKALMEATDESVQRARQAKFMQACSSPALEREFLMETSMINCVRESYAIR